MIPARAPLLRSWLQLLRVPNLFTVPGDVFAGCLLAGGALALSKLWLLLPASLCLYGFGLLLNDLVDLPEDTRDRPFRPLPAGAVHPVAVGLVATALAVLALTLLYLTDERGHFYTGILLGCAILSYNAVTKSWFLLGPLNMGLCRLLNVLLGAGTLFRVPEVTGFAGLFGGYIAGITLLAWYETKPAVPRWARLAPGVAAGLLGSALAAKCLTHSSGLSAAVGLALTVLATGTALRLAARCWRRPQPLPPQIGAFIRVLLLFQAALAWAASAAHPWPVLTGVLLLLSFYPLARLVGRRFYAS